MGAALREKRREVRPFAVAGRACACDARELLRRGHTRKDISNLPRCPTDRHRRRSMNLFTGVHFSVLSAPKMYGTDENSGLLDANRRRGVGGVPMALQAAMLVAVALALAFLLYHIIALPVDLEMLPSWKSGR